MIVLYILYSSNFLLLTEVKKDCSTTSIRLDGATEEQLEMSGNNISFSPTKTIERTDVVEEDDGKKIRENKGKDQEEEKKKKKKANYVMSINQKQAQKSTSIRGLGYLLKQEGKKRTRAKICFEDFKGGNIDIEAWYGGSEMVHDGR
ncbi:hypothetical protein JHK85_025596 [Glycine max]|nr:hypothetical protein JHK85_025596 [Glycine max]KAG5012836.1 hypothetical protein JHK86_025097 [Glycine max]